MKFRIEGDDYEFQEDTLTVAEARLIKKHTGMGLKSFVEGSKDGDPDSLAAVVFLAKRRAGEAVRWQDLDSLDLAKLEAIDETIAEEPERVDAADPIWPSGQTPTDESPNT
jgi:hypothetical protein